MGREAIDSQVRRNALKLITAGESGHRRGPYRHGGGAWDALFADLELHAYRERGNVRRHRKSLPGTGHFLTGHLHSGGVDGSISL